MQRYYITLGASTTANGKVTSATHVDTIDDAPMALDGDSCWCPACNAEGIIALDGPRLSETVDGREVALSDDLCICKCTPPPRLVTTQTFAYQLIDAYSHAAATEAAAATAAQLNTSDSAATDTDDVPLVLLDPDTREPFRHRPYRLECGDQIIQGTTDQDGTTRPLTAAERASFTRWHIDDATSST